METFSDSAAQQTRDHRVAGLAFRQRGVVTRAQLVEIGFSLRAIDARVQRGLLHVVAPGIYAVGHARIGRAGQAAAALLQVGPGAALSHQSAARLWGLVGRSNDGPVHVSVTTRRDFDVPRGVVLHRPRTLRSSDLVLERGMRTTTPERTIVDLMATSTVVELTRMLERMVTQLGRDPDQLHVWARGLPARAGRARLFEALDWVAGPAVIRSEFESLFRSLCQEAGLTAPVTNHRIERWETDAVWLRERVAVELDSWAFHGGRWQFHQDRRKGLAISKAGFELIRLTWWQLKHEQAEVVEALSYALARGRGRAAWAG